MAKPDEGRWDETIPVGEVSDHLRSTIQLRAIRSGAVSGCALANVAELFFLAVVRGWI